MKNIFLMLNLEAILTCGEFFSQEETRLMQLRSNGYSLSECAEIMHYSDRTMIRKNKALINKLNSLHLV